MCRLRTNLSMKLSAWMTKTETTATALAEKVGVSHTTIGRIARGEMEPRPDTRRRIVKATGGEVTEIELLKLATSEAA